MVFIVVLVLLLRRQFLFVSPSFAFFSDSFFEALTIQIKSLVFAPNILIFVCLTLCSLINMFTSRTIFLSPGAAVTWPHHDILVGKEKRVVYATDFLALVFTGFQGMEYYQALFTISHGHLLVF
ncbi:uncharacterized protein LOC111315827 [Durio zibethinus]|uniref:Uncharacterized protein LOC111315827 n=1 Tax=Durio zibethinus TaxID=66656 RepID=A0A6P6B8S1_DURZI|nr:uncharacterized protein LOC111315827 [Durio zibethinus]